MPTFSAGPWTGVSWQLVVSFRPSTDTLLQLSHWVSVSRMLIYVALSVHLFFIIQKFWGNIELLHLYIRCMRHEGYKSPHSPTISIRIPRMAMHEGWRTRSLVMWRLLVSFLSFGFILARPQHSQPYCFTDDIHPYRQFATKTPYNYSRGHFSHLDLVPEGK